MRFCRQEFGEFPRLVGRYCSYLLPKQAGRTPQIFVFKTLQMAGRPTVYMPSGKFSKERNMLSYLYFPLTHRVVFDCVAEPPVLVAGQHEDVGHLPAVPPEVPHSITHPSRRRLPGPLAAAVRPLLSLDLRL